MSTSKPRLAFSSGIRVAAIMVCGISWFSCAPIAGPVTVEAVVPIFGAVGGVTLGDVTLKTVTDLERGEGEAYDVRGNLRINLSDVNTLGNSSYQEMLDAVRANDGDELEPHMAFDGERYVADDFETLFYFTMFANFEAAIDAAVAVGDTSRASSFAADDRAVVGLFASLVFSELLPLPLLSSDNAAYLPPLDGWLALRSATQEGVPFAMHRGVAAHEFGHRLFFQNVFGKEAAFEVWRDQTFAESLTDDELRSQMLLKGVDEGLADIFAVAVMRDVNTIPEAFTEAGGVFVPEADRRDFEGAFATAATWDNLRELSLDTALLQSCGLTREEFKVSFNFYCVGTVLAASLWETANRDVDVLADEVMPAIVRALPAVGDALAAGTPFDLPLLLEPIAAELPPDLRARACQRFGERFESLVVAGAVPTCR